MRTSDTSNTVWSAALQPNVCPSVCILHFKYHCMDVIWLDLIKGCIWIFNLEIQKTEALILELSICCHQPSKDTRRGPRLYGIQTD